MSKNYNQVEDFIADDSFLLWFNKTDTNAISKWDFWITENPEKKELVNTAVDLLQQIQLSEAVVNPEQLAAAEQRLKQAIHARDYSYPAKVVKLPLRKIWYAAAGILIITVLAIGLKFMFNDSSKPYLATAYGQVKQEKLPDGTEVILNANSKISYPEKWATGKTREVWISGEAFFHVKKTAAKDKFIVHTDAFDIEVTGTSFNVINREGKSSIVLKEGSVKIHRPGEAEIVMKPGDQIAYAEKQIQLKTVTKTDYLAWTESKLIFDNTTLKELAAIIKEHYGVEVKIEDEKLSQKTITGIMPNDNLDALVQSLEAMQEFSIQHTKTLITITNKDNN